MLQNTNSCAEWIFKQFYHCVLAVGFTRSISTRQGNHVQGSTYQNNNFLSIHQVVEIILNLERSTQFIVIFSILNYITHYFYEINEM